MRLPRGDVRYHVPRDRSPVPAVLLGALVVLTLVPAQLSIAGQTARPAPSAAVGAAQPADPADGPRTTGPGPSAGTGAPATDRPAGPPAQVEVAFAVGEDSPSGDTDALLGPVVRAVLADPTTRVRVVGHAEDSDDPVLEEQLSLRRAQTVLGLLVERGMPPGRADVFGAGAAEAGRAPTGTDRRVSVEVLPGG